MTHFKHFKHLHVPDHWQQYWSKYPQGYTIMEALISWVSQVDLMTDNVNDWNNYLDQFVQTFDTKLQDNVRDMVYELYDSGKLAELTAQVIDAVQDQIDDINSEVDTISSDVDIIGNKTDELYNVYEKDSVIWFGQEPLEQAINRAVANKKKLKILQGVYEVFEPVTAHISSFDLIIEGSGKDEGLQSTTLVYRGEGTFLTFTGVRFVTLRDLNIVGTMSGDNPVIRENTIAIAPDRSLVLDNVVLANFDTLVRWIGGYYHKSINCTFRCFNKGFDNVNGNNFIIDKCRILEFNNLLYITGGQGQTVISNSSVEWFTGNVIQCTTGTQAVVDVVNSYIENISDRVVVDGLLGSYKNASFAVGVKVLNMTGNYFYCQGITRVVYSTSNSRFVRSEGNHISYPETGTHQCYYFAHNNVERVIFNDVARAISSDGDEHTPVFMLNSLLQLLPSGSHIWNCYENTLIQTPT